jgi:hypothetical protein
MRSILRVRRAALGAAAGLVFAMIGGCSSTPTQPAAQSPQKPAGPSAVQVGTPVTNAASKPKVLRAASFEDWRTIDLGESALDLSKLVLPDQWTRDYRLGKVFYQRRGEAGKAEHLATWVTRRGTGFAMVAIGAVIRPDCGSTAACVAAILDRDWQREGIRVSDLAFAPRDSRFGDLDFHNFMIDRGMCSEFQSEAANVGGAKRPSFYTIICMPYIYHIPPEEQRALVNSIVVHADRL